MARTMSRQEVVQVLDRLGVRGADVYLVDLAPLCEMALVDGQVQEEERVMIHCFLESHLERLQQQAGAPVVPLGRALRFVDWMLAQPLMRLRQLRALLPALHQGETWAQDVRRILDAAEAVGAAAPSPAEPQHAWDKRELDCMWELQDDLLVH